MTSSKMTGVEFGKIWKSSWSFLLSWLQVTHSAFAYLSIHILSPISSGVKLVQIVDPPCTVHKFSSERTISEE